jgi:hypothetical protein
MESGEIFVGKSGVWCMCKVSLHPADKPSSSYMNELAYIEEDRALRSKGKHP